MRYTVYNKAMKRPVFQTNDLVEAIDYTRRHPRKSRRHCIYDDKLKTFDIKKNKTCRRNIKRTGCKTLCVFDVFMNKQVLQSLCCNRSMCR